jgi:hypothetical protein
VAQVAVNGVQVVGSDSVDRGDDGVVPVLKDPSRLHPGLAVARLLKVASHRYRFLPLERYNNSSV